ncbi:glycosyltransferase family 4 protein [Butyrivibrio sp.]|uniref:glycosyltransferase family 4 protein n=1 Tax=Butyrivibrio sp. TaxID=28121 RepID=UPI0025BD8033|nr:glycosyltransferase family 4 protein [Butyrivibrio sp.]MBE5837186.1 glycosyltransferase family 4 protein [Butyrivibrio sp.]
MKILILTHSFFPEKNGISLVNDYMAKGLSRDNEVIVITEKKDSLTAEYNNKYDYDGICVYRIGIQQKGFKFYGEKARLRKYIEEFAPDVLICVCVQTWTFDFLSPILDEIDCKKILYNHGSSAYFERYPLIDNLLHFRLNAFKYNYYWYRYYKQAYKYIKKFDKVIYLSENNSAFEYAQKYGLSNGVIIENAVEDDFFNYIRNNNICDKDSLNFIYVSNYDDNKNQKAVLNAFYHALEMFSGRNKNITLRMIGGQDEKYYNELCEINEYKKNELKKNKGHAFVDKINIELFYGLDRLDMKHYMKEADIFLMGSRKEQYPIVLCEAAASGLMIISTNVGHAEKIPGCTVVNNYNEMAERINEVLNDSSFVYEKGQESRAYAMKHYRIEEKVKELISVVKE